MAIETLLTGSFKYNGLGITSKRLKEPVTCRLLGVMMPCDPGMVTIEVRGKQREVPTFLVENCPKIDFGRLLSKEQIKARAALGVLVGSGIPGKRTLMDIHLCPLSE